ncbi:MULTISPECIES: toxin-antitoxin system HicB family antitoxin [unclassified Marinobacter]|jgi:predicted HicB family RNase H-like nuclease|uniref:toxin-antitoxin system HicB family antitoxin n=1 Tax=unclassified Marinobacter TaxID=83889 RepID=UPI00200F35AA|nr:MULTISPECIES: toxin-antitoxin system HicB family antitoxin [unclassified Marinobacter]MCL1481086.1 toxin-antitoxin system HicB family antitoxin [Marinobacter sp.]MCL1488031.1 toxin-antitoxin system HicB family antitoxin [Marinobacter sp.]UQG56048.1 toxin-antitoxin system HicB family antitoxin [Marinobacter sp. M4C]UQG64852.1 toxin-antitoxin system HicB family antitoxin [Marinobacter sp. M2C]UQG69131.1 toxin-antitoxin system HicB family antitoxin [Marinobacter sp. M1C]
MNAYAYNITVRQGLFEGEECFEARVKELPDIAEYGDSHVEAYELALDSIETTAEFFKEKGRKMPQPCEPEEEFSGRVTLRLPKTLHRGLATKAEEEGVSLNQLLVSVLATFRGFDAALENDRNGWTNICEAQTQRSDVSQGKVIDIRNYREVGGQWS